MNHYRITPEDFIRAWQGSATVDEVVKKTGVPTGSCYSKAAYYRSMGGAAQAPRETPQDAMGRAFGLGRELAGADAVNANPYDEPTSRTRRTRRLIIEYQLSIPDPQLQPALDFDPPQPAVGDQTIEARFAEFHRSNPHVYRSLRDLALAKAEQGARRISPKLLFEELRAGGVATATGDDPYQLNNIYTSRYARLLAAEPGLTGRIPMRAIKSE